MHKSRGLGKKNFRDTPKKRNLQKNIISNNKGNGQKEHNNR